MLSSASRLSRRRWRRNSHTPYEQPIGVDVARRARDQSHKVASWNLAKLFELRRRNDFDLVHTISESLPEDLHLELVGDDKSVQLIEHFGPGKPIVCGQHRMRSAPAHWQARPIEVADTPTQCGLACSVKNRQLDVEARDSDRSKRRAFAVRQLRHVRRISRLSRPGGTPLSRYVRVTERTIPQKLVVPHRVREERITFFIPESRDLT